MSIRDIRGQPARHMIIRDTRSRPIPHMRTGDTRVHQVRHMSTRYTRGRPITRVSSVRGRSLSHMNRRDARKTTSFRIEYWRYHRSVPRMCALEMSGMTSLTHEYKIPGAEQPYTWALRMPWIDESDTGVLEIPRADQSGSLVLKTPVVTSPMQDSGDARDGPVNTCVLGPISPTHEYWGYQGPTSPRHWVLGIPWTDMPHTWVLEIPRSGQSGSWILQIPVVTCPLEEY